MEWSDTPPFSSLFPSSTDLAQRLVHVWPTRPALRVIVPHRTVMHWLEEILQLLWVQPWLHLRDLRLHAEGLVFHPWPLTLTEADFHHTKRSSVF